MTDDLERDLDTFYRDFDAAGRRIAHRWKKPATHRRVLASNATGAGAWVAAGLAAAAALLVIVLANRGGETTKPEPVVVRTGTVPPSTSSGQAPLPGSTASATPPTPPKSDAPEPTPPLTSVPTPPRTETPPVAPSTSSGQAPPPPRETTPEPPPKPAERAVIAFADVDGTFDVAGRKFRGAQKDFKIAEGDKLRAESVMKLTIAPDRFIILAARSQVSFAQNTLTLDQGELLAELIGKGRDVRIVTRACEINHIGTVFSVRIDGDRSIVMVEEGRVECRNAASKVTIDAGQQATATAGKDAIATTDADLRRHAWTRAHRPTERPLFTEAFDEKGAWEAQVAGGISKGAPSESYAAVMRLESGDPIFRIPARGRMTIVYRAERAATLMVQLNLVTAKDRLNFHQDFPVQKSATWKTLVVEFDKMVPREKSKRDIVRAGDEVREIFLQYGETGDKANFEVDSITVTELRP